MGEVTPREIPTAAPGDADAPTPEEWGQLVDLDRPVPEGVREITQDPLFDASIDTEDEREVTP